MQAQRDARLVDDDKVGIVVDAGKGDELAGLLVDVHRAHTLAAAVGHAVGVEFGALADAVGAESEDGVVFIVRAEGNQAYDLVVIADKGHAPYARRYTAHCAQTVLVKADGLTALVGEEHLAVAVGKLYANQTVVVAQDNGFLALRHDAGVF